MGWPVRVLHAAGFRFDSPLWEGPATWAAVRNQDLWQTFEAMLTLCRQEQIDFLFLAGDLFEQDYVRKVTTERVAKSLAGLGDTKVFIAPGETDPLVVTSAYRLAVWPGNVHIFSGEISRVEMPAQNAVIYGAGWTAYRQERPFLNGFQADRDGQLHMMLLHAEVEPQQSDGFVQLTRGQIEASRLAYLALGHQQAWSGIQQAGKTFWADCGSPEARGFRESGPHGVLLAEIAPGSARFEFRELGQRRYVEKTLSLLSGNPDALAAELLADTGTHERQRDLFRVRLTGPSQAETKAEAEVQAEIEAAAQTLQKLLTAKLRYVEVMACEPEAAESGSTDNSMGDLELQPEGDSGPGSEARVGPVFRPGFPTLAQVFAAKIQARLAAAESAEELAHWELVRKIGLAALRQGRIDPEAQPHAPGFVQGEIQDEN